MLTIMFLDISYIKLVAQINFIHTKLEQHLQRAIENENLDITKTRAMILSQIRFKGSINQKSIADLNNISPQAVHRHIKILEEKKYIIRKKSTKDMRAQNFELTQSGRSLIQKSQKIFIVSIKDFFKDLNASERKTLITLLSKVNNFDITHTILN